MPAKSPVITKVIIVSKRDALFMAYYSRLLPVSIGVILDDSRIFWGDLESKEPDPTSIDGLLELITPCLKGQSVSSYRRLIEKLKDAGIFEKLSIGNPGLLIGLQRALLAAVAHENKLSVAQTLAIEYAVEPFDPSYRVPIYLEVHDAFASAELFDQMLARFPDGLSYSLTGQRITESIGRDGQYLQRFVRELASRVNLFSANLNYWPDFYISLNGAFGQLIQSDPATQDMEVIRNIGKVLGNIVGLQIAAGDHRLFLEEPILLSDPIAQMAHLKLLGDMLAQRQSDGLTQLSARASRLRWETLKDYLEPRIVDCLRVDFLDMSDLDSLFQLFATMKSIPSPLLLAVPPYASPRLTRLAAAIALAFQVQALILNFDSGSDRQLAEVERYLNETSTDFRQSALYPLMSIDS
jgi:hypothetical protein